MNKLKKIFHILKKKMDKNLNDLGITSSQLIVLMYLYKNISKSINQRDIEKEFDLTNPTVNGILSRLEKKQFITRNVSLKDARNNEIKLTEKTNKIYNEMIISSQIIEKEMIENITEEELVIFEKVLDKIIFNISKGGIK